MGIIGDSLNKLVLNMGTRNLTMVVKGGETKVAQYGQWDGHLEHSGVEVLNFLRAINHDYFYSAIDNVAFITEEEMDEIIENYTDNGSIVSGSLNEKWWSSMSHLRVLSRDRGVGILWEIVKEEGRVKLKNSEDFAHDSLFCEYAYVLDLDRGVFEVYEGFNQEAVTSGRFQGVPELNGCAPVKFLIEYDFDSLPSDETFLEEALPLTRHYEED